MKNNTQEYQKEALELWETELKLQESQDFEEYTLSYSGPLFRFGNYFGKTSKTFYGKGVTEDRAASNILVSIKNDLRLPLNTQLSLDKSKLEIVDYKSSRASQITRGTCDKCGAELTDGGFCLNCDDFIDQIYF